MSTIGNTLFSQIEINGQLVDISTLDANDGLYQLPAGYTSAHVVFTMKDNTSFPRGVFEENTYITGVTLPDAMNNIASYSFHGVTNINTNDRNAILAINPYAFDAEPIPPGPEPKTDPDLHYTGGTGDYDLYTHIETIPSLVNSYNVSPISYVSSDTTVATVNSDGTINYLAVGNTSISASFAGDSTYEADTTSFTLTIHDSTPTYTLSWKQDPITITESTSISGYVEYTGSGTLNYSSSNPNFYVDNSGFVYGPSGGVDDTTNITVSDGTLSATVVVNYDYQGKQSVTAGWYENGNPVYNGLNLVQGAIDAHTLTFQATPSDSWTFNETMSLPTGVTFNTTTGEINVTANSSPELGTYYCTATRMEDSSYYASYPSIAIKVYKAGTDLDFHFDVSSVSLDNQSMTTSNPYLINNTGIDTMMYPVTYSSDDTNIATVASNGTISFVGAGTTTVTATLTNGNETHTATVTVYCSQMKQMTTQNWYENGNPLYNGLTLVEGAIDAHTLTFQATPNDSWSFSYNTLPTGITFDTTTGEISIASGAGATASEYYFSANRNEDSNYYMGYGSLNIRVLPAGTDVDFHYTDSSVNLDNSAMTTSNPYLYNNTGIDIMMYPVTYSSADTNVATVASDGTISFVGGGTTTVTATISDGTSTHTATITVNCSVQKQYPNANWYENGNPVYNGLNLVQGAIDAHTLTFQATPSDSWTFYETMSLPTGVTFNTTTGEINVTANSSPVLGTYYCTATRMEDSSYYASYPSIAIKVYKAGTDLNFYYDMETVNLDNSAMTTSTPMLNNTTGIDTMMYPITYSSADTSVATVDNSGMITYVGPGQTTVTATLSNGNETHTATITVYCTQMSA